MPYLQSGEWPKTLDEKSKETVRQTLANDLIKFHHGWGTGIRNDLGLWRGNTSLRESCGGARMHPDSASRVIIHAVWKRLQSET